MEHILEQVKTVPTNKGRVREGHGVGRDEAAWAKQAQEWKELVTAMHTNSVPLSRPDMLTQGNVGLLGLFSRHRSELPTAATGAYPKVREQISSSVKELVSISAFPIGCSRASVGNAASVSGRLDRLRLLVPIHTLCKKVLYYNLCLFFLNNSW